MKIDEILLEADYGDKQSRSTPLSVEEFKKLLPNLQVALQQAEKGVRIYRGLRRFDVTMLYTDPTKSERVSANTSNELTLLVSSVLPSWKSWPKRSRSLICTGSYEYAKSYTSGDPLIVLPIGNPDIGVVPDKDFWDGFGNLPPPSDFNDLFRQFNGGFRHVFQRKFHIPRNNVDVELLQNEIKAIDSAVVTEPEKMKEVIAYFLGSHTWNPVYQKQMVKILTSGDAIKTIDRYYSPDANGFELRPLSELKASFNELWFSAPAVLISPEQFDRLMN
jgi:hypothetical protein